jgi:hypothetical protein
MVCRPLQGPQRLAGPARRGVMVLGGRPLEVAASWQRLRLLRRHEPHGLPVETRRGLLLPHQSRPDLRGQGSHRPIQRLHNPAPPLIPMILMPLSLILLTHHCETYNKYSPINETNKRGLLPFESLLPANPTKFRSHLRHWLRRKLPQPHSAFPATSKIILG